MINWLKLKIKQKIFRKHNKHNFTNIVRNTDIKKIKVGKGTYGNLDLLTYGGNNSNLYIGNYCSIANDTVFIMGGEHTYNRLLSYPFKAKYLKEKETQTKGDIVIEDDVWIGYGTTILSGVKIGKGAIIGARSVVAKDIPSYAIYVGNRIIKYRFSESVIEKIQKIDFEKINEKFIKENIDILYKEITEENIDKILKEWNEIKE